MSTHEPTISPSTAPHATPHVLIVDDEEDLCEVLAMRLEHHGYRVSSERGSRGAIEVLERETVDAMILDVRLDGESGLDLLSEVQARVLDLPVVMLTAHGTIDTAVDAMGRGAYGFLTKPFHDHELLEKIAHAVERVRLRREVAGLRRMVDGAGEVRLLGTSGRMQAVRELLARAAPTDSTVLLLGESGTGKELAARALHALSHRAARPFVAVHCGALPGELLESELFGHVRGAFTGAVKDRLGVFASAEGGTVFLDEIGDASPGVQLKLLRVLQERTYQPVGATTEREADVRIVAATNRELRAEVAAGRFREDLFYRLHVVPLLMPPLRERREDVPLLVERFVSATAARLGRQAPPIMPEAMHLLLGHDWPGNVRELANVVEAAMVLAADRPIRLHHIQAVLSVAPSPARPNDAAQPSGAAMPPADAAELDAALTPGASALGWLAAAELPTLREARERFDRAYLLEALRRAGGNVTAAARLAGRNRTDFHDLLRRHDVSASSFREDE
jgi:two-component system response regulator GlrR